MLRNLTLSGINMAVMETGEPGTLRRIQAGVQALLSWGMLRPQISEVFAFEQSGDAMQALEDRRSAGKVVVRVKSD
jgi:NADPH:quinone reductase-like Zn-dependent oxidoreductase